MPLPRSLTAVPRDWHVHQEIAKAIQALFAQIREQEARQPLEPAAAMRERELLKLIVRDIPREFAPVLQAELLKAGFRPDQPRWPKGSGDESGRWSGGAGTESPAPPKPPPPDAPPTFWSIDPNQKPPSEKPPEIPPEEPEKRLSDFLKAAAQWLARAGLRRVLGVVLEGTIGGPVGDFLLALEAAYWLSKYLPYIRAYLDAPKTWEELQKNRGTGYDEHHIVEQWSEDDGIPREKIDAPENRVCIPTLKHWEINAWLDSPNDEFKTPDGEKMSPREYMRGKSWDERYQFGLGVLRRFGVLSDDTN
jgi:hypothetical protein